MCVHEMSVCAETMNSAESVIIRVFDQHLCVLLQPRKEKNATFLFSHHLYVYKEVIYSMSYCEEDSRGRRSDRL